MKNAKYPHRRTLMLTVSAMLSALGVVLLGIGSIVETLDLTAAALASVLCIYAVIELGGAYPWMIWAVTSMLGILLLPQKTAPVFYLFIGCYPILKEKLEKLPRGITLVLKLVVYHIMIALVWVVLRIFLPQELELGARWMLLAVYALGIAAFLLFDLALTRLITFYLLRLRKRIGIKKK